MPSEGELHTYASHEAGEYLSRLLGDPYGNGRAVRAAGRQTKPIPLPDDVSEPEPDLAPDVDVAMTAIVNQ